MSHIVSCEGLNFTRFILNLLVLSFVGFLLGSGIGGPLEGSLRDVSSLDVTMKMILSKLLLNLMEGWWTTIGGPGFCVDRWGLFLELKKKLFETIS